METETFSLRESVSEKDIVAAREIYRETLHIPSRETAPKEQILLCPVGLVGAGKSTVIRPLSERFNLVRVSSDEMRKVLIDNRLPEKVLPQVLDPLMNELIDAGYSLAIDIDCGSVFAQALIREKVERTAARPIFIHINTPEAYIVEKLRNYNHTWLYKDADAAIADFYRRKALKEKENLSINFFDAIDTSAENFDKQLKELTAKLEKEIEMPDPVVH